MLEYGTLIVKNTFANNFSGKRGSALLIERINEVQVIENKFMNNGPVHAYREIEYSPYVNKFLKNNRTLTYYSLSTEFGACADEWAWLNMCYRQGFKIDMPQIQGALHVRNCFNSFSCWYAEKEYDTVKNMNYTSYVKFYKPWQRMEIRQNSFYDNQANIVMFPTQR